MLQFYSGSARVINTRRAVTECMEIALGNDYADLYVSIRDNGVGFDPAKTQHSTGLKNIQSRVALYAGAATITSAPGEGCTLDFTFEL